MNLLWKAKAKTQRRELESLRLSLQRYRRAAEAGLWLAMMMRQNRQMCNEEGVGDSAPFLSTTLAEIEALETFDVAYRNARPEHWYPTINSITTA